MNRLTEPCWEWALYRSPDGYGRSKGRMAHRMVYERVVGPIPEGLQLDHLCRNRACVNPSHLEPVTKEENWRRGYAPSRLARLKTHCPQGHPYSGNLYMHPSGRRVCRACNNQAQLRYQARKRAGRF